RTETRRKDLVQLKSAIGLEVLRDAIGHARNGAFRGSRLHFERPNAALCRVQQIAEDKRVQGVHAEIHREIKTAVARRRIDAAILRERKNAKSLETGCGQGSAKLRFVHAEAAGPSAGGREVDVLLHDLLDAEPGIMKAAQITKQIADREIDGIAQAAGTVFLGEFVGGAIGVRQMLPQVSCSGEQAFDQALVLPGETSEEDGYRTALFRGKGKFLGPQGHRRMSLQWVHGVSQPGLCVCIHHSIEKTEPTSATKRAGFAALPVST